MVTKYGIIRETDKLGFFQVFTPQKNQEYPIVF